MTDYELDDMYEYYMEEQEEKRLQQIKDSVTVDWPGLPYND